jgi:hypothetical protein
LAILAGFSRAATFLVAIVAFATMFLPWQLAAPRTYPGLDPNLIFVNEKGNGGQGGSVAITGNSALITARENSTPAIHLVDSESDFAAEFDMTPFAMGTPWQDATVVAQPPAGARYYAVLVGAIGGTVLFRNLTVTPAGSASTGPGSFSDDFADPGLSKWLSKTGVDRVVTSDPTGFAMRLTAAGQQEVGTYTKVVGPIPTASSYEVKGTILVVAGAVRFKIALEWFDSQHRVLGYAPDWPDWARFARPFVPAMISIWHPRENNAITLMFTTASAKLAVDVVTQDAMAPPTTTELMTYSPGSIYHIRVAWTHDKRLVFRITGPARDTVAYTIDSSSGLALFREPFVNLSVEASAPVGAENALELRNVALIVPASTRFAENVSDQRLTLLTMAILVWALAHLTYLVVRARTAWSGRRRWRSPRRMPVGRTLVVLVVIAALCSVYTAASYLDGHPFDRLSQEGATYVINQYGIGAVYGRTSAIPDAVLRGGNPWSPAEFVYPPGMLNYFIVIAKVWQAMRGAITPMSDRGFYMFWKTGFALFIIVDAALLYAIAKNAIHAPGRWPWVIAVLFVINPAVIFDVPIWGQSNALLLTPLLTAILALMGGRSKLLWSSIVIALLVKQTALLVVPLIAIFAFRRFGLQQTVTGAAFGMVMGFAFIAPLVLSGYHPATVYLTTVGKIVDFGTPLTNYTTLVSLDTFPIWVLFSGASGLHGHDRLWSSDGVGVGLLHLTYADAGLIIFLLVAAISAGFVWRAGHRENTSYQRLFLAIALIVVSYVTLNTRTSAHYLVIALPFLLLALPQARLLTIALPITAITASVLLSEYGLFMFTTVHGEWPVYVGFGTPGTNVVSGVVYRMYTSDVFITLFALMMAYVVAQLVAGTTAQGARSDATVARPG